MDSIADILRDLAGILSTSNNLTIYCLGWGPVLADKFRMAASNMISCSCTYLWFLVHVPQFLPSIFVFLLVSNLDKMFFNSLISYFIWNQLFHLKHFFFLKKVIYVKLNLQIEYLPAYAREVWDYSKTHFDLINKAI